MPRGCLGQAPTWPARAQPHSAWEEARRGWAGSRVAQPDTRKESRMPCCPSGRQEALAGEEQGRKDRRSPVSRSWGPQQDAGVKTEGPGPRDRGRLFHPHLHTSRGLGAPTVPTTTAT